MSLSDYERQLLMKARESIEQTGLGNFVCCAISEAHTKLSRLSDEDFIYKESIASSLRSRVQKSLDGHNVFEYYLYSKHGCRPEPDDMRDGWLKIHNQPKEAMYFPFEEYYIFIQQARLAWIDRMLDNNEVS